MVDLDEYDPPDRPDFRRIGKGIPYVVAPSGKRERYSRSSNGGKILDDESNLTDWKLRTVIAGAAQRPELMAAASVLNIDTEKKALRDIAEKCLVAGKGERRSVIGTAVHAMFDHLDRGDEWIAPPNFIELCMSYVEMKYHWGFEVEDIEIHCINDRFRLAGTLDRRFRTTKALVAPDGSTIPIGSVLVADLKTGKELEYAAGSYCTQLAAYVDSLRYDVVTDERYAFDPPSVSDWALIIHADSADTRVDVYWVDIESGRLGLELATKVKEWRRRSDLLTVARLPVDAPLPPVPATIPPEAPRPADGHGEASSEARAVARATHLRNRVRAIIDHSEIAGKALQRNWPRGIPGLKNPGHSWEQLDEIQSAIEEIEKDYSVPFGETWIDPMEMSMRNHPSNGAPIPRAKTLMLSWVNQLTIDDPAELDEIINVLIHFANLPDEWSTPDIDLMLLGSIRAIGANDLSELTVNHGPMLLSAAFAISAGTAILLFDENENPIVRVPTER
jgi:hypothetical protein